ncbi:MULTISPECIES: HD-GYP domain-containing protein [unclassified Oceanispirochaeta]|uniref:HD-GYP domain-containing protein n=1 Tax=unclassified Oceanispirochaeta TaxID=2635722 RepID=UPI000E08D3E3|nr:MULTISPECIES: HD domain-containing phosphohydrolase [unclassified Oceanispirochaeta]MBF9017011.1 HD domain-containing protein [Oceanispirochaeta sp. M2]NPD73460.1 HD domain-containing protein [Oceanispirochaeta sp. M1]RDG30753.1 HD domain-containing protein [Oceanispirochaeta sp. M1]
MTSKGYKFYRLFFKLRNLMILKDDQARAASLQYWQQFIFINLMITIYTLALPAVVAGTYQFYIEGMIFPSLILPFFYIFFILMGLLRRIPYKVRQGLVSWGFYIVSIALLLTTGPRGAGQFYISLSIVLLLVFSSSHKSWHVVIINTIVFLGLSALFYFAKDSNLLFLEFGAYWWIIVTNALCVSLIISMTIRLILKGMDRRYTKSQLFNKQLIIAHQENMRQIKVQEQLRQSGMVMMDSRLDFEERLHIVLRSLEKELQCTTVCLSLAEGDKSEAVCIAALPDGINNQRVNIPDFSGSYLEYDYEGIRSLEDKTPLMLHTEAEEYYYGCRFYTSETKGYLELLMPGKADQTSLNYLQLSLFQLGSALTNEQLIRSIKKSRDILEFSYDEILQAWARILELRDIETQGHSRRVVSISLNIALKVNLPEDEQIQLKRGAFLHDIGKLGIPDRILKKEGPLNDDEWTLMRRHPEIGRDSVINIPFLKPAVPVIYHHHERWDGTGYPSGLKGEDIPLAARIFILADVYDALISDRPYRKAMEKEEIVNYMKSERGTYFDPDLLDIFLADLDNLTYYRELGDFLKA